MSQWPWIPSGRVVLAAFLVSALAVLDRYSEVSEELIRKSLASSWNAFEGLAPDGAWPEGPSYWSLAMRYAGLMVAALESTLDHGFGLVRVPSARKCSATARVALGLHYPWRSIRALPELRSRI